MARKKGKAIAEEVSPEPTTEEKPSSEPKKKKAYVWDPSDGVSFHDFLGLFFAFLVFLWKLIRLILSPLFWIISQNGRMIRFVRAEGQHRVMNEDERIFVESTPLVFTMTGIIGGVFLGIITYAALGESIEKWLEDLDFGNFFSNFFGYIATGLGWIWDVIVSILKGIGTFFGWIFDGVQNVFSFNEYAAWFVLLSGGFVLVMLYLLLLEKGVFKWFTSKIRRFVDWIGATPDKIRLNIGDWYRRFNHRLTAILVGADKLETRTQAFFRRSLMWTAFLSVYTFVAGVVVGTSTELGDNRIQQRVVFIAVVLTAAGLISGVIMFAFLTRFLDLLNREKYIAPEFKDTGAVTTTSVKKDAPVVEDAVEESDDKKSKASKKRKTKKSTTKKSTTKKTKSLLDD